MYYNAHRHFQAVFLLPHLQHAAAANGCEPKPKDHRVLHAHRVLEVLGRKMAQPSDAERPRHIITDTCFPSLLSIARDTCLSQDTVRWALADLISWGFLRKTNEPGHRPANKKYGNVYDHCRYWVVPEIWDLVESPFDRKAAAPPAPNVPPPVPTAEDVAGAAALELSPDEVTLEPRSAEDKQVVAKIHAFLQEKLGEHSTYDHQNADAIMADCVDACVETAGSAVRCLEILKFKLRDDPKLMKKLMDAQKLGGYIQRSFPGWITEFDATRKLEFAGDLSDFCAGDDGPKIPPGSTYLAELICYIRETLGNHLLSHTEVPDGDKIRLNVELTDRAKIAHLLSHATGKQVSPDDVPEHVDASTVEQVSMMIDDDRMAKELRAAADPLAHFVKHWTELDGDDGDDEYVDDDTAMIAASELRACNSAYERHSRY